MAPHPVLLAANLFSGQTQLGSIVPKPPSKSQGEFVDRIFSFKWEVKRAGNLDSYFDAVFGNMDFKNS